MRAPSIALTSLLCIASVSAVLGYLQTGPRRTSSPPAIEPAVRFEEISSLPPSEKPRLSLAGKVLVAAPDLDDPYFARTVIYMLADDDEGSLGLVLNRPRGAVVHGGALARLWNGGPVGRDHVFVLHDDLGAHGSAVIGGVAVSTDPEDLDVIMDGKGPAHARVFVGYAGWAQGQLEGELDAGVWRISELTPRQVVSDDTNEIVRAANENARAPRPSSVIYF